MSSEIVNSTSEIPPRSPEVKQDAPISPNGTLNPNAAVFTHLSLMTLSDKSPEPQTQTTEDSKWQQNAKDQNIGTMADSLQYSPPAVNGYGGPYQSPGAQSQENSPDNLSVDELKASLQHQLEYYFSRENLSRDSYLISQMDNDSFVPIWTVANFNQIKKLTSDLKLIKEVLRESPLLQMDELCEKVRANVKRCIVVLREIPESTPIEEVSALFEGEGCPKHTKCEFVSNDYWYIHFDNEDCAQKAYRYLREEVRTFKGKQIMARIKANTIHQAPPKTRSSPQVDNSVVTPPHQAPMYSPRFQFPTVPPPAPMFNNAQYGPFYPNMVHTWPPPTQPIPYADHHMAQGFPPNGFNQIKGMHDKSGGRHFMNRPSGHRNNKPGHNYQGNKQTNGSSGSVPPSSSPNATSANTASSGTTSSNASNREISKYSSGSFRKDTDEFSRRNQKPLRRRRGSSEDISRHLRTKENRSSPVRHSKDDSDTLDLAPSSFPPLPTAGFGQKQASTESKEAPEQKSATIKPDKPVPVPSPTPAPWSKITENSSVQNRPKPDVVPAPKPTEPPTSSKEPLIKAEKSPISEKHPAPQAPNPNRQAEKMSYAQMAAQKGPKPAINSGSPPNNQTKSPGK